MGPTSAAALTSESPRKKSFWSFLYLSSATTTATAKGQTKSNCNSNISYDQEAAGAGAVESPASSSSFGRKVARSRSVGCGSRSFSGDFLERISTGFGDCTLRRVESHREPNNGNGNGNNNNKMAVMEETARIKERVKCGGIFGGFGMISTSASSSYWLAAAAGATEEDFDGGRGRIGSSGGKRGGRSRSWAWSFASPMRAFRPASAASSSSSSSLSKGYGSNAISSINAANSLSKINAGNSNNVNGNGNGNGKVGGNANPSLLAVGS